MYVYLKVWKNENPIQEHKPHKSDSDLEHRSKFDDESRGSMET